MADDFTWLVAMHRIANQYGDGLKPELLKLLSDKTVDHSGNVVPLNTRLKSSGPAEQSASTEALSTSNIIELQQQSLVRTSTENRG